MRLLCSLCYYSPERNKSLKQETLFTPVLLASMSVTAVLLLLLLLLLYKYKQVSQTGRPWSVPPTHVGHQSPNTHLLSS